MVLQGKALERVDVGLKNDKISKIGDLSRDNAELVIDATGKFVSPGFIDLTSHSDTHWTLFNYPEQESFLAQGITTVLGGNCGASLAPLIKIEDIEGIQKWVDVKEINFNWRRISEFLDELEKHPLGVNYGTLIGHGTLRRGIVGNEARKANEEEIKEMKILLDESLKEGAWGISTNLGAAHGRPSDERELASLFNIVKDNAALAKHHIKDEGKNILPAIVQLIQLERGAGFRTHFSHFKVLGKNSWPFFHDALSLIENARDAGQYLTLDFFPYTRTGSELYSLLPPWIVEGSRAKIISSLKSPPAREEAISYLKSLTLHYDRITIASTLRDQTPIGKTVKLLSESSGISPEEFILELLEINELNVSIFSEVISEEHIRELAAKDYAAVSSDGVGYNSTPKPTYNLPHPRSFGTYPKALEMFSKSSKILEWGPMLQKITELPAKIMGINDRGKIERDFFADITIFSPEKIGSRSDYSNPYAAPNGIDHVLINGEVAYSNGNFAGFSGRVLRKK